MSNLLKITVTISRRTAIGGVAAAGLALLGTVAGTPAAHALLPNDPGHERRKGKGKGGNLLRNPSFELDAVGTTISNWMVA
ncbi:unannotated protein [freshwater metagenome]|uniref:Unannotated protein n=1 Tax=freshwater metagenome TaxID=449393 RepID=A0A6J6Z907_9ZZZZ